MSTLRHNHWLGACASEARLVYFADGPEGPKPENEAPKSEKDKQKDSSEATGSKEVTEDAIGKAEALLTEAKDHAKGIGEGLRKVSKDVKTVLQDAYNNAEDKTAYLKSLNNKFKTLGFGVGVLPNGVVSISILKEQNSVSPDAKKEKGAAEANLNTATAGAPSPERSDPVSTFKFELGNFENALPAALKNPNKIQLASMIQNMNAAYVKLTSDQKIAINAFLPQFNQRIAQTQTELRPEGAGIALRPSKSANVATSVASQNTAQSAPDTSKSSSPSSAESTRETPNIQAFNKALDEYVRQFTEAAKEKDSKAIAAKAPSIYDLNVNFFEKLSPQEKDTAMTTSLRKANDALGSAGWSLVREGKNDGLAIRAFHELNKSEQKAAAPESFNAVDNFKQGLNVFAKTLGQVQKMPNVAIRRLRVGSMMQEMNIAYGKLTSEQKNLIDAALKDTNAIMKEQKLAAELQQRGGGIVLLRPQSGPPPKKTA